MYLRVAARHKGVPTGGAHLLVQLLQRPRQQVGHQKAIRLQEKVQTEHVGDGVSPKAALQVQLRLVEQVDRFELRADAAIMRRLVVQSGGRSVGVLPCLHRLLVLPEDVVARLHLNDVVVALVGVIGVVVVAQRAQPRGGQVAVAAAGLPALLNGVPAEPAAERLCRTGNGVNLLAQLGKGGRRGAKEDGHLKVEKVPQKGLTEDVEDVGGGEVGQQAPLLHLVVEDGPLEERRLAGAVHGDQRRGNGAAAAENARAAQSGDVAATTTTSTEDNAHRAGAGQAG